MQFHDDNTTAAAILRRAIPEMVRRQIPVTPVNFALWYAFVADLDRRLREELERSFPQPGLYDARRSEELFYQYIIRPMIPDQEQAQQHTASLLADLLESVLGNASLTRDYAALLEDSLDTLQRGASQRELEATMDKLLQETQRVRDRQSVFQAELDSSQRRLEALREHVLGREHDAFLDLLTGLGNERHFRAALEQAVEESEHRSAVLRMDIDEFGERWQRAGDTTAARVLQAVGEALAAHQGEDIAVARLDQGRFAMAMRRHALEDALAVAQRLRRRIGRIELPAEQGTPLSDITASFGVAEHRSGEGADSLLARAESALQRALSGGRSQVKAAA